MKGLVYKDFSLFYKSIDKKLIIIAAAVIILLLVNAGDFSGLLATIMFAMTIGMQNVMSFASDECIRRWPAAVGAVLNGSGAAAAAAS